MVRRFTVLLVAAAALLVAGAGSASADPTGNETCGGRAIPNSHQYVGQAEWLIDESWTCGVDKIFSMEIQHTLNGGQTVYDVLDGREVSHRSPAGCNILCNDNWVVGGLCPVTGSYRIRTNWADGFFVSAWVGAGKVCSQFQQQFP